MRGFTIHKNDLWARNTLLYRLVWNDAGFYVFYSNDATSIEDTAENTLYTMCYGDYDPVIAVRRGDFFHCIEDYHWSPEDYIKFHEYAESIGFIEAMHFMVL